MRAISIVGARTLPSLIMQSPSGWLGVLCA